ncbi:class I SAM-dependent methyltransferase [Candidatus Woesearchaeota archaeon]|nr:class I SAM-dependent methyltransferase [Candidatus Woesearchaeota archaeon]
MLRESLQLVAKTYDKIAKPYFNATFEKISQYHLDKFISMLPKKSKVLDAGCGPGRDSQYFKEYGLKVTAIDCSSKMIAEAKKKVKGVTFKKMDMMKMGFKDKTFDGVWASASIIHEDKKDLPNLLKEIRRVLKCNGILYVSAKEGKGSEIKRDEPYNNEPRQFFCYTVPELEDLLAQAGFAIVSSEFSEDRLGRDTKWIDIYCKKPTS